MGEVPYEAIPKILKGMVKRGIYLTLDEAYFETDFALRKKYGKDLS